MEAWDQLPPWARRQNMYASYAVSPVSDQITLHRLRRAGKKEAHIEQIFWKELLHSEELLAAEIGHPIMGRRDGPIAEWSGLRTREARKGAMHLRGQP